MEPDHTIRWQHQTIWVRHLLSDGRVIDEERPANVVGRTSKLAALIGDDTRVAATVTLPDQQGLPI